MNGSMNRNKENIYTKKKYLEIKKETKELMYFYPILS